METTLSPTATPGHIVLAAYQPDPVLFERQLVSIRAQTVADFRCLIVADGGAREVEALVKSIVPGDDRFHVIGADQRVGFYRNFERGLEEVPLGTPWVALSDQDDYWYPDKLERMLPHLSAVSLVAAQARVVAYPSNRVLSVRTERRDSTVVALMLNNQVTGGMTVMRAALLERALPFPRYSSPAEVHDHWLALVAACDGGVRVIPDVVQDYVQHGKNVLGEESREEAGIGRAWRNLRARSASEDGLWDVRNLATAAHEVSAGWAQTMADTLAERLGLQHPTVRRLFDVFGRNRALYRTAFVLMRAVGARQVPVRNAVVYLVGATLRPLARR